MNDFHKGDFSSDIESEKTLIDDTEHELREEKNEQIDDEMYEKTDLKKDGQSPSRLAKNKPSSAGKKFFQSLVAGVIGAIFTLAMVINYPGIIHNDIVNKRVSNESEYLEGGKSDVDEQVTIPTMVENISIPDRSLADMVEEASKAIVGIVNYSESQHPFFNLQGENRAGSGSGVIFKKEGNSAYIVTNNHVIERATKIEVSLQNGEVVEAELIGKDALTDIAVLKIDSKHVDSVLQFGNSDQIRAGDQVVAIGNPLGLEFSRTVTKGIVSATERTITVNTSAGRWELNVIQTDAAINPGNSGGALLSLDGKVIGINSLKIATSGVEGLGFAIPSNEVVTLVDELIKNGQVERPFIGISMIEIDQVPRMYLKDLPDHVKEGIVITAIEKGSAADIAGIEEGDVLVSLNDTNIATTNELRKYLYTDLKVGDTVIVKVYRGSELKELQLKLTSNLNVEG